LRKSVEAAERREEVRGAARAWNRTGAIDDETLAAIVKEYPDDRFRVRPAFRALFFLFTLVAAGSAFAVLAAIDVPVGALLFSFALGSVALTEVQTGKLRRSGAGAEEATALLSFGFSIAFLAWSFDESGGEFPWRFLSGAAAVLASAAAWRWGLSLFGALAAASLFLSLSFWSGARACWVVAALALVLPLLAASVSPRLAPSPRRAADAALVTALAALYFAVHLGSYDGGLLERSAVLGPFEGAVPRPGRFLHIVGTTVVPLVVLAGGILLRRPLLLRMGVVLGVASLVTLRFYVHVAPLWVVLIACGGAAVAMGMLLNRFLASGPGGERHGFTAEPLFGESSRTAAIEAGLAVALAPGSTPGEKPEFRGAGGEFGGGGASGKF
jgi:hypothetical protein